ncbi:MAG: hypothetical protein R3B06_14180 [Kofleriaceae bacterium]
MPSKLVTLLISVTLVTGVAATAAAPRPATRPTTAARLTRLERVVEALAVKAGLDPSAVVTPGAVDGAAVVEAVLEAADAAFERHDFQRAADRARLAVQLGGGPPAQVRYAECLVRAGAVNLARQTVTALADDPTLTPALRRRIAAVLDRRPTLADLLEVRG